MPSIHTKNAKHNNASSSSAIEIVLSDAEAAFNVVGPRFAALPIDSLINATVDLQIAAVCALKVCRFVSEKHVRARFAKLAKTGEYNDTCVEELAEVAKAAWFARHRFLHVGASEGAGRVDAGLLEAATAHRGRMIKVAEYWLGDDPAVAAEITAIRVGTGHQDLANDLVALGGLFERHERALSHDKKLFKASDRAEANRLAGAILEQLSTTSTYGYWSAMQPRAWTLLLRTYTQVRRGGLFLFADDGGEERFPSLVSVCRAPAVRSGNGKEKETGEVMSPGSDAQESLPAPVP